MSVVTVYSRLYAKAFQQALVAIRKNLWTLLLPVLVIIAYRFLVSIAYEVGFAGGILLALGRAAIFSAYLFFLAEIVARSRVSLADLKRSLGAYFWSLVNLSFILWIANLLLSMVVQGRQGGLLLLVFNLVAVVALNAAPEVIYQRGTYGGLQTIQTAVQFLQDNWLEWIVPNIPLFLVGYLFFRLGRGNTLPVDLGLLVVAGALAHVAMVFRGYVFAELAGSSHRQRMFAFRNG